MDTSNNKPAPKKPNVIGAILLLVAIGLTLYMTFAEVWPVTKLIEIQAGWFDGSYYPKLTFLITLLIVLLPLLVINWIVQKVMKK